jgi:hypothetical protein
MDSRTHKPKAGRGRKGQDPPLEGNVRAKRRLEEDRELKQLVNGLDILDSAAPPTTFEALPLSKLTRKGGSKLNI